MLLRMFRDDSIYYGLLLDRGVDPCSLFEFEAVLWMFYRVWSNMSEKERKDYSDDMLRFEDSDAYAKAFWERV